MTSPYPYPPPSLQNKALVYLVRRPKHHRRCKIPRNLRAVLGPNVLLWLAEVELVVGGVEIASFGRIFPQ